jgi:HAD superfamily hydrolase (TIGR01490 family)
MPARKTSTPSGIDLFDVDHTVIDASTSVQFLLTGIRMGIISYRIFLSIPRFYWQYHFGEMDFRKAQQSLRGGLGGIREKEISRISRTSFEKKLRGKILADAERTIRGLTSAGRKVAFVTSSFIHIVQPLADHLGVEFVLANSLVYEKGVTTGAFREPFLFGNEKKNQALAFLKKQGVSPRDSSFYTDSVNDLSLLEAVGNPVVVNPDPKLKQIARDRQWQMVNFR